MKQTQITVISARASTVKYRIQKNACYREAKASAIIASVERQMYYNNNTAQHSLLRAFRGEIIEKERNKNSLERTPN